MQIKQITQITEAIVASFARLMPQLNPQVCPPGREALQTMLDSQTTFLFGAFATQADGFLLGAAALVVFHTPTGIHAWVEDVIVDLQARRQGLGHALTQACLNFARQQGAQHVYLTSRPQRIAANQLYQQMGFKQRQTNVYAYYFADEAQDVV